MKSNVYMTESLWRHLEECDRVLTARGHMCVKEKQLSVKEKSKRLNFKDSSYSHGFVF